MKIFICKYFLKKVNTIKTSKNMIIRYSTADLKFASDDFDESEEEQV